MWLAQLSRQYGRHIARLDEIPDEELATLAASRAQFAVADRRVGAQPRLEDHQAALRQPRRRGLGLFALRLLDCRRPGRRGGLHQPARPRLPPRHSPGQRHGSQPHGHRFALGDRAPGVVHLPPGFALSRLQLQRARSLARRPRGNQDRGPLFRAVRRRGGVSPPRPCERRDPLHLPRQRRHQLSLERHRAARLPESGGARAGDSDHSARGAAVSGDSLRRCHDAGQAAFSPALVSRARDRAAPFLRAPNTA